MSKETCQHKQWKLVPHCNQPDCPRKYPVHECVGCGKRYS